MRHVVVVGHGMVGSRFVDELTERDPHVRVTVLGAEEYEPYNRVLLSEVVAGVVDVASLTLARAFHRRVVVRPGVIGACLDLAGRVVVTGDGERVGYDALVLATGARARMPALTGLAGADQAAGDQAPGPVSGEEGLPVGVHTLRTLDDAREIVAATVNARRAVVLGAGVLGLEAACGLAGRGLHVTMVHAAAHLMDRQLDAGAASAVAHGLHRLGIELRLGVGAEGLVLDGGRLRALVLDDGAMLPADLLVLTVGTVPETGLAARSGLEVRRGIVVDDTGMTADPRVFAIGDCAEPPEGGTGLIAQGWDQARRLAARLCAGQDSVGDAADRGTGGLGSEVSGAAGSGGPGSGGGVARRRAPTDVVRVKAHGLAIVTMGMCGTDARERLEHRRVRLSDPTAGRHVEVVVADGVVVGATCVGAGSVAADLQAAYTRRTPVPSDPAQLLLPSVRGPGAAVNGDPSPTLMSDRATVCRCNGVTKGDLVACWHGGARSLDAVAVATRATTGCGGCTDAICGLLDWLARSDPSDASAAPLHNQVQGRDDERPATAVPTFAGRSGNSPVRS